MPTSDFDTSVLSPSKARRDAAQAKDWAFIASWLTQKYHPKSVPRFERNDDTLQALLQLVLANATADEQANHLRRAQEEEYDALVTYYHGGTKFVDGILGKLESQVDPAAQKALDEIAEASVELGCVSTNPEVLARDIVHLTSNEFELESQVREVEGLRQRLEGEIAQLQADMEQMKEEQTRDDQEVLQQQIAEWNRASKMLAIKFAEYRERVTVFERMDSGQTIDDLRDREAAVTNQKDRLRKAKQELQLYHGLPPDLEAAREEYHHFSEQVVKLRKRRDELFESMAHV